MFAMFSGSSLSPGPARIVPRLVFCARPDAREIQNRCIIHAGKLTMPLWIPHFEVQQHQIDLLKLFIAAANAEGAIGVKRGMDPHRFNGRKQLHRKSVLHERFGTAQRESSGHDLQPMTILA